MNDQDHTHVSKGLYDRLRTMKMVLIDDDEWVRNALCLFFQAEGCCLLTVETAEEGLELLDRDRFDVIIADYRLPGMDGVEFFRRIRSSHSDAIKILVSAYGSAAVVSEAVLAGIQEFIAKPFTADAIEAALERLMAAKGFFTSAAPVS